MTSEFRELPEVNAEELDMSVSPFQSGAEKDVYRGTYKDIPVVIKVYRDHDQDGHLVDRGTAAREELQAYNLLLTTQLAKYIPKPYGLFTDVQGHITGIIVEPKPGEMLGTIAEKIVPKEVFDQLELDVRTCKNIVPSGDTLMDANIGFDGKNLWFAEAIADVLTDRNQYERRVTREMHELRTFYQIKE